MPTTPLTFEQFEEAFALLYELQRKTDSKCQALVILADKQGRRLTRINDRLSRSRHNEATRLKTLRNRVAQLTAEKMTLKQQNAELLKFQ